ncbi:MAG: D-sedoheptulose 7-phosphate isomerase [Bacteroidales bacterium]|nr:D-sedoheptulose 7-phosphate isomerase [Bacteroidales bacterium]
MNRIQQAIQESIEVKQQILNDSALLSSLEKAVDICIATLKNNGKILFCGNGGSAADAQHLAAELSGRFYFDRPPLNAEALHVNTSFLTAVANDYSYDEVFARMTRAQGHVGDTIIGLSTSGNSPNVVRAFDVAKELKMNTIAFTGKGGGKMREQADVLLNVPSGDTPRIQESHILLGHLLCELVESRMFG